MLGNNRINEAFCNDGVYFKSEEQAKESVLIASHPQCQAAKGASAQATCMFIDVGLIGLMTSLIKP